MSNVATFDIDGQEAHAFYTESEQVHIDLAKRGFMYDRKLSSKIKSKGLQLKEAAVQTVNRVRPFFNGTQLRLSEVAKFAEESGIVLPVAFDPESEVTRVILDPRDQAIQESSVLRQVGLVQNVVQAVDELRRCSFYPDGRHTYSAKSLFRTRVGKPSYRNCVLNIRRLWRRGICPQQMGDMLLVVDAAGMEVAVAAALSGDARMRAICSADDPHAGFESVMMDTDLSPQLQHLVGARRIWKQLQLSLLNGLGAHGLSSQLGIRLRDAYRFLETHRQLFAEYWRWSDHVVTEAYRRGWARSPRGYMWQVTREIKELTLRSWPIQAAASDICRAALLRLMRGRHRPFATLHDAFYFSVPAESIDAACAEIRSRLAAGVNDVLPAAHIHWKETLEWDRLHDGDDDPIWLCIETLMQEVGCHER